MTKGKSNPLYAGAVDVASIERLYAQGQRVEAIHKCRALALRALPGHAVRLQSYIHGKDPALWSLPRDESRIETFLYRQVPCENNDAAEAMVWCAKWLLGRPDTRSEGRAQDRRTVIVRGLDAFADLAFVALRKLVASGELADAAARGVPTKTHAKKAAAARHQATNALRKEFEEWCTKNWRAGMTAKMAQQAFGLTESATGAMVSAITYSTWLTAWKKKKATGDSAA